MTGDARRQEIAAQARVSLAVLHLAAEQVVTDANQAAGGTPVLVAARPSVLDATWPNLRHLSWQASNFEAAMTLLQPLMEHGDGKTLGAVLKTADQDLVRRVTLHLVEAGVLQADRGNR